jgi:hypothetical protein
MQAMVTAARAARAFTGFFVDAELVPLLTSKGLDLSLSRCSCMHTTTEQGKSAAQAQLCCRRIPPLAPASIPVEACLAPSHFPASEAPVPRRQSPLECLRLLAAAPQQLALVASRLGPSPAWSRVPVGARGS